MRRQTKGAGVTSNDLYPIFFSVGKFGTGLLKQRFLSIGGFKEERVFKVTGLMSEISEGERFQ